jgi:hypothetical protein
MSGGMLRMNDTYQITCPCCNTILIIERRTGKLLEERRPILEQSTGDRYQDAVKKVKERGSVAEEKFRKFQEERNTKMDRLNSLFKDTVKRVEESGEEVRPDNPLDRD